MFARVRRAKAMPGHEGRKSEIGLVDAIAAMRAELSEAVTKGDEAIQFPVDGVDLEFHVVVTQSAAATGGIRFWVIELGGRANYESQSVHKVTVSLGAPVDANGETVRVYRTLPYKP